MPVTNVTTAAIKYNQIPEESRLKKDIKPLGPKERIQYRVYGAFDPEQPGKFFGRTLVIPTVDVVLDPDTQEVYDIAYIKAIGAGGMPEFGEIIFEDFNACTLTLSGGSANDRRIYEYLELCNYLVDNPHRDNTKRVLIERIDENKDLSYKRDKRKRVVAALSMVNAMSDQEVLNFIRANRIPDAGTPDKRRATVEDLAETKPEKFANMPTLDYTSLYEFIDAGVKAKILSFNNVTREWQRFDGAPILHVKKGMGVSQKEELAMYLIKDEGRRDLDWLKTELKK